MYKLYNIKNCSSKKKTSILSVNQQSRPNRSKMLPESRK